MAVDLGFDGPTANSLDATSDRDFVLEFVQVLSQLSVHLSRWAEEMILFSTQEVRMGSVRRGSRRAVVRCRRRRMRTSWSWLRKGGRVIGANTTLLVAMKGLPLAYNKDMQGSREPFLDATFQTLLSILPLVTG